MPLGATGARFFTNAIDTKTIGLDLNVNYRIPLDTAGDLRLSAVYNMTDNDILRVADTPAPLAGLEQVLFDRIERRRVECGQPRNNYRIAGAWNRRELSGKRASRPLRGVLPSSIERSSIRTTSRNGSSMPR